VVLVDSESAMETQQMVTLGALIGNGSPAYLEVIIVHELAHQWFGNAVTPRDWRAVWLNEGFAMYIQGLWEIEDGRITQERWLSQARSVDGRSRATAGPPGGWDANHFGESNIYFGPALMLHAIHEEIGDDKFFAMARDWVQSQRHRPVDRAGFTAFVNRHTGRDYTALINRWLDSPTTPD
jgi:aminopeptidase N